MKVRQSLLYTLIAVLAVNSVLMKSYIHELEARLLYAPPAVVSLDGPPIEPTWDVTQTHISVFWFDSLWELQKFLGDNEIVGEAHCEYYNDQNFSHCDIFSLPPQHLDDEHVLTLGHELLHALKGEYHD